MNTRVWWYKPWRRRWVRIVLLLVLGVAVGAWGMGWFIGYKMQAMMAGGGPKGMKMTMPVEGAAVNVVDIDDTVRVPGGISAEKGTVLRPEVAGVVKTVTVSEGVEVSAGTVLVQLSDTSERADAAQAQAAMRQAERSWKRVQALRAEDMALVSQKDYDAAQSAYEQARATYEAAKSRLEKKKIAAPFAGVTGLVQVNPGDLVSVGEALVSLQTLRDLRVDFSLPERFSSVALAGQEVTVRVGALNRDVTATVIAADPLLDAASRNVQVRARIDNAGGTIRPGMFGEVTVSRGHIAGALMIPEAALMPEGDKVYVYRFIPAPAGETGKVADRAEVQTGIHVNGMVQVVSGLAPDDIVVSAGQMKIGPGAGIVAMNIGMVSGTQPAAPGATVPASPTVK